MNPCREEFNVISFGKYEKVRQISNARINHQVLENKFGHLCFDSFTIFSFNWFQWIEGKSMNKIIFVQKQT